jgi:hypothetical protein
MKTLTNEELQVVVGFIKEFIGEASCTYGGSQNKVTYYVELDAKALLEHLVEKYGVDLINDYKDKYVSRQ